MKPERTKEGILTELIRAINPKWDYGKDDEEVFRNFWYFFNPEPARTIIRKAMEEYRRLGTSPVESKWVSVKEQAPPDYKRVLWIDNRDNMINLGYFVWSQTPVDYCTHWQPLPELPIEETKEK